MLLFTVLILDFHPLVLGGGRREQLLLSGFCSNFEELWLPMLLPESRRRSLSSFSADFC